MIWHNQTYKYVAGNNPDGFKMPYPIYGRLDKEIKEWAYYRLSNKPKKPWHIRLDNHPAYGGYRQAHLRSW
jgi:hypothetical protein